MINVLLNPNVVIVRNGLALVAMLHDVLIYIVYCNI